MTICCHAALHLECDGRAIPWTSDYAADRDLRAVTKIVTEPERPCDCWCHRYEQRPRALQEGKGTP